MKVNRDAVEALGSAQDSDSDLVPLRARPQKEPGLEGAADPPRRGCHLRVDSAEFGSYSPKNGEARRIWQKRAQNLPPAGPTKGSAKRVSPGRGSPALLAVPGHGLSLDSDLFGRGATHRVARKVPYSALRGTLCCQGVPEQGPQTDKVELPPHLASIGSVLSRNSLYNSNVTTHASFCIEWRGWRWYESKGTIKKGIGCNGYHLAYADL